MSSRKTWIPLPAVWYPVWVTLDENTPDALEVAVVGMVRGGVQRRPHIARELCLPDALVEEAVAALITRGILVDAEGVLSVNPDPTPPLPGAVARSGWIAWDPRAGRPLRQLWLAADRPEATRAAPPGWEVVPIPERAAEFDTVAPPRTGDVDQILRLLPQAGDLLVLRPFGAGVDTLDGARVTRLRRKLDARWQRDPVWAPVEHRLSGTVAWRPCLVPLPEIVTELDPGGWEGVLQAAGERAPELERTRRSLADEVAPGVLKQAGFSSVEELRETARRKVELEVGAVWPGGWEAVQRALEEAFVGEPLARAVGADWRRSASAWADVLDAATEASTRRVFELLPKDRLEVPSRDAGLELRRLLGPTFQHVTTLWTKPEELAELRRKCEARVDTIGTRVLVLGAAVVADREARRAAERVDDLFPTLDKAVKERNRVVHPREHEPVDVGGFRARVIAVVKALLLLPNRDNASSSPSGIAP